MNSSSEISVILADDHAIVRAGFGRLLDNTPGIRVAGEASSADEACKLYAQVKPDVAIMDLSMPPGNDGLDAIKRILASDPKAKVMVLTMQESEPFPSRVMKAGARAYLTKRCSPDDLVAAVRKVYAGETFISPEVIPQNSELNGSSLDGLTKRELQIFAMLAGGSTPNQIAEAACISQKTVHVHRSNILSKLGISNNSELICLAIRHGVVDP